MPGTDPTSPDSFTIVCIRCERPLTVRRQWIGRDVQCTHCSGVLRVPPPPADGRPARALTPTLGGKRQFNFGCPRCQTLLEAHTGFCGQPGRCPTCGARLVVPELNPRNGMPLAVTLLDTDDQDPTPIHAYAASGGQAPRIVRLPDGGQAIECPRCNAHCDVDADACPACGAPFTIDAAPTATSGPANSWAVTSIVLGIVSLPLFALFVPGLLAIIFGLKSLRLGSGRPAPKMGIFGIILGLVSLAAGLAIWFL